jgi:hypothetical protein
VFELVASLVLLGLGFNTKYVVEYTHELFLIQVPAPLLQVGDVKAIAVVCANPMWSGVLQQELEEVSDQHCLIICTFYNCIWGGFAIVGVAVRACGLLAIPVYYPHSDGDYGFIQGEVARFVVGLDVETNDVGEQPRDIVAVEWQITFGVRL